MFHYDRYRRRSAMGLLVWLFAVSTGAVANPLQIRRTIRGRISMPDGSVARTIKVKVEDSLGELMKDGFTDTEGVFEVNNLGTGSFVLTIPTDSRTYETAIERIEINRESPEVTTVSIHLETIGGTTHTRSAARGVSAKEADRDIPAAARQAYKRGVSLARKGRLGEAIVELKRAVEIHSGYIQAYNELGLALIRLDQVAEASAAFEKAVSLDPKAFNPRLNLGIAHVRTFDFTGAEQHLRAAVSIDSSSALAHLYLGIVLYRTNRVDAAEDELSRAASLDVGDVPVAHYYLGDVYSKRDRAAEAIAQFEIYLKEKPEAEDARQVRRRIQDLRATPK